MRDAQETPFLVPGFADQRLGTRAGLKGVVEKSHADFLRLAPAHLCRPRGACERGRDLYRVWYHRRIAYGYSRSAQRYVGIVQLMLPANLSAQVMWAGVEQEPRPSFRRSTVP